MWLRLFLGNIHCPQKNDPSCPEQHLCNLLMAGCQEGYGPGETQGPVSPPRASLPIQSQGTPFLPREQGSGQFFTEWGLPTKEPLSGTGSGVLITNSVPLPFHFCPMNMSIWFLPDIKPPLRFSSVLPLETLPSGRPPSTTLCPQPLLVKSARLTLCKRPNLFEKAISIG